MKRCCNLWCRNHKINNEGYQVSFGFMLWACPEHAMEWQLFDEKNRIYENDLSVAYEKALKEFEANWDRDYEHNNPKPVPPAFQASEIS